RKKFIKTLSLGRLQPSQSSRPDPSRFKLTPATTQCRIKHRDTSYMKEKLGRPERNQATPFSIWKLQLNRGYSR
ncbi:hypothetical protein CGCVW01_v003574, partial [Colletotrichum viniferum]